MTHKGRRMQGWVKVGVLAFVVSPFAAFAFARAYTFDAISLFAVGYTVLGWLPLTPEERADYWTEYRRWANEVATLK